MYYGEKHIGNILVAILMVDLHVLRFFLIQLYNIADAFRVTEVPLKNKENLSVTTTEGGHMKYLKS